MRRHRKLDAILLADVAILRPAGIVEHLVGGVEIVLPGGVGGGKRGNAGEHVLLGKVGVAIELLRDQVAPDREIHCLADGGIGEDGIRGVLLGALAVDFLVGIGEVEIDRLDGGVHLLVDLALLPGVIELLDDLGFGLHVPGVVVLPGLDDGAAGGDGIATTLEGDLGEEGLGRLAIVVIRGERRKVVRREGVDLERSGADRLDQEGVVLGLGIVVEDVGRVEHAPVISSKWLEPGDLRLREGDHGGQVILRLDPLDHAPRYRS